jgi:cysteine desulfuration protein SufE
MQLDEIIETFEALDEGEERYRFLMDLGKQVPGLDEIDKTEASIVRGCQSRVWMVGHKADGALHLRADSDAFIVRGLIAVLLALYDGQPVERVLAIDPKVTFEQLGLDAHLSMGRRNGLWSMVQRVRALASA